MTKKLVKMHDFQQAKFFDHFTVIRVGPFSRQPRAPHLYDWAAHRMTLERTLPTAKVWANFPAHVQMLISPQDLATFNPWEYAVLHASETVMRAFCGHDASRGPAYYALSWNLMYHYPCTKYIYSTRRPRGLTR